MAKASALKQPMRTVRSSAQPRVTHPDRVIDAASGATKGELVDFYARITRAWRRGSKAMKALDFEPKELA